MDDLAPVVLFVYNRLEHTVKTLNALKNNELSKQTALFIFSDAPKGDIDKKSVDEVRKYIKTVDGFKSVHIIFRESNFGLANSIIDGVSNVINQYGKVIVLEDDLVSSPFFLKFMNKALNFYQNKNEIMSISGYNLPPAQLEFPKYFQDDVYINIRPMSWSWGTWKNRWTNVHWEMDKFSEFIHSFKKINKFAKGGTDLPLMLLNQKAGLIDSWYIRWCFHAYETQTYTVYPVNSLIQNLGFDESGVHGKSTGNAVFYHSELIEQSEWIMNEEIQINKKIIKEFNKSFNLSRKRYISLLIRLFTRLDKRLRHNI